MTAISDTTERQTGYVANPNRRTRMVLSYLVLFLTTSFLLIPVIWLVLGSFKGEIELSRYPVRLLPDNWDLDNYIDAITIIDFPRFFLNSAALATISATLTVVTSSLGGYAFARMQAPGRNVLFGIVMALLMIPNVVFVIPQYIIFSRLNLVGTWWPWVIWGITGSAFHMFLFRQFFSAFPKELEDAAEVDGAGPLRIWWQIFMPNALPVVAVSFILAFAWMWGDWFTPLLYLGNADNTTLSVQLATAYEDPNGNPLTAVTLAGSILYTAPLVILFFIGQRWIMEGVVTTGLKG